MKNYIKLLTLIIFALFIYACSDDNKTADNTQETKAPEIDNDAVEKYDFRQAKWGMSMQEVKETEDTKPVLESESTLDYSLILLGMQAQVGYTFKDDELVRAGFFFLTKLDTKNEYIEKYTSLKEELTKVNGKPVIDTEKQKDSSQKIDPENKGEAICNGNMLYATQWDLPTTDIQLVLRGETECKLMGENSECKLMGENSECKLTILYLSEEGLRQLLKNRAKQPSKQKNTSQKSSGSNDPYFAGYTLGSALAAQHFDYKGSIYIERECNGLIANYLGSSSSSGGDYMFIRGCVNGYNEAFGKR